jgi:hypothetical protein
MDQTNFTNVIFAILRATATVNLLKIIYVFGNTFPCFTLSIHDTDKNNCNKNVRSH